MATRAEQLPYTPLKPILLEPDRWPKLKELVSRVSVVAVATFLTAFLGLNFSLVFSFLPLSVAVVGGGVMGAVAGVALTRLIMVPSSALKYRIATLDQLKGLSAEKVLRAIQWCKQFFQQNAFRQFYQHHQLHTMLTRITDAIDKSRKDLVLIWSRFLHHIHGIEMPTPEGSTVKLDVSLLTQRLEGKRLQLLFEALHPEDEEYETALDELVKIEQLGCGARSSFSATQIKEFVAENPENGILLARSTLEKRIEGFCIFRKVEDFYQITCLMRRPESASLGIGQILLFHVLTRFPKEATVRLLVRESNPARHLYLSFGFEEEEKKPNFYIEPNETGILMKRDWEKFFPLFVNFLMRIIDEGSQHPSIKQILPLLHNFLLAPDKSFEKIAQLEALRNLFAQLTNYLQRERPNLKIAWRSLLQSIHGVRVKVGEEDHQLDLTQALTLFQKNPAIN